jgi:hypothetical protein
MLQRNRIERRSELTIDSSWLQLEIRRRPQVHKRILTKMISRKRFSRVGHILASGSANFSIFESGGDVVFQERPNGKIKVCSRRRRRRRMFFTTGLISAAAAR